MAFKQGVQQGNPVLIEPVMAAEIVVPEDHLGEITGDLSARRASIGGIEARPAGIQVIQAMVPLAEMFGYATDLRSMTQGRGVFTMEFNHYSEVDETVAKAIVGGTH